MTTVLIDDFRWKANAARIIDNVLDYTHFPCVHDGLLGSQSDPQYPEVDPQILDDGLRYQFDDDRNNTTGPQTHKPRGAPRSRTLSRLRR